MGRKILNIGITDYKECYDLQKRLHNQVKKGSAQEHIIITEHRPVITIGRSGSKKNLLVSQKFLKSKGINVIETDRGGDITYHGPGQIMIYPIIDLRKPASFYKDVHKYLHFLENMIVEFLTGYDIDAFAIQGKTGVWTDEGKIASIGVGVSGWVTYHGIALNVDCDLKPFEWIHPCGFKDISVTSMEETVKEKCEKVS